MSCCGIMSVGDVISKEPAEVEGRMVKLTDKQIISCWVEVFQRAVELERRTALLTEHCGL